MFAAKKKKKRGQEHYTDGHTKGKTKTKKIRLNTKRLAACNPSGYFKNFGVLQWFISWGKDSK